LHQQAARSWFEVSDTFATRWGNQELAWQAIDGDAGVYFDGSSAAWAD
jgi:hypothetical protein